MRTAPPWSSPTASTQWSCAASVLGRTLTATSSPACRAWTSAAGESASRLPAMPSRAVMAGLVKKVELVPPKTSWTSVATPAMSAGERSVLPMSPM